MDEFFEDESVEEVALLHISQIQSLEEKEAKRILKLYNSVRSKLRDRLDTFPTGSFSEQQARGVLMQVDLAIAEMNQMLNREMGDSAGLAAEEGVDDLISELNKWNKHFLGAVVPINFDAVRVAADTKNFLINQYETSIQSYGQLVRARITRGITESLLQQQSLSETISSIGKTFMGEEWKLQQIVRTELHNVYNVGKINGMKDLVAGEIPDLMKTLFHPMDKRTGQDSIQLSKNNPIVPVDEPFVETSTGKKLVYMCPPNRPNDRSILIPYRSSWDSE